MKVLSVPFRSPSFSLFALNGNLGTKTQQAWTRPAAETARGSVSVRSGLALARTHLRFYHEKEISKFYSWRKIPKKISQP